MTDFHSAKLNVNCVIPIKIKLPLQNGSWVLTIHFFNKLGSVDDRYTDGTDGTDGTDEAGIKAAGPASFYVRG